MNEELKESVREADKDVTNAMATEHLKERFRNPMDLIHNREAEFASWKPCKGSANLDGTGSAMRRRDCRTSFNRSLTRSPWRGSWICLSTRWAGRSTCPRSNCTHVCWLSVMSDCEDEYARLDDGELGHRQWQQCPGPRRRQQRQRLEWQGTPRRPHFHLPRRVTGDSCQEKW